MSSMSRRGGHGVTPGFRPSHGESNVFVAPGWVPRLNGLPEPVPYEYQGAGWDYLTGWMDEGDRDGASRGREAGPGPARPRGRERRRTPGVPSAHQSSRGEVGTVAEGRPPGRIQEATVPALDLLRLAEQAVTALCGPCADDMCEAHQGGWCPCACQDMEGARL